MTNSAALRALAELESRLSSDACIAPADDTSANGRLIEVKPWIRDGLDRIPLPGQGQTLARWRALAAVGAYDLSAAKLYESHTDARAILAELAPDVTAPEGLGAVWAAENGSDRLLIGDDGRLHGRKPWCSGAHLADWALLTAWPARAPLGGGVGQKRHLVLVDMRAAGIAHDAAGWHAVGMAETQTGTVRFDNVPAAVIGNPDAYLDRPGFWQGGVGIAAVWFGAACAIGARVARGAGDDPFKTMHLGAIDGLLSSIRALLGEAAREIDAQPQASAYFWALRTRTVTDDAARRIVDHAARALGAAPLCQEAGFAKRMADLPVFLRQSHAEKDLAALGKHVADEARQGAMSWRL